MRIDRITKSEEVALANTLKEIYYEAVIEETHDDSLLLLKEIILLVEKSISSQKSIFEENPELSYRIPSTHELAVAFLVKYKTEIVKAEKFAYSINESFGYTIDIGSIVCPYVLYQLGVTNENLSFYLGLGMVIAKIVCNMLAKNEERRIDRVKKEQTVSICKGMKHMLEGSKKYAETEESCKLIELSILEIDKIINSD